MDPALPSPADDECDEFPAALIGRDECAMSHENCSRKPPDQAIDPVTAE
jgi:hypothetical protein